MDFGLEERILDVNSDKKVITIFGDVVKDVERFKLLGPALQKSWDIEEDMMCRFKFEWVNWKIEHNVLRAMRAKQVEK